MTTLPELGNDQEILVPLDKVPENIEDRLGKMNVVTLCATSTADNDVTRKVATKCALFTKERFHAIRHALGLTDYELQSTDIKGLWLAVPRPACQQARQRYIELSAPGRISSQLNQVQAEITRLNEQIETHQQQLVRKIRQLKEQELCRATLDQVLANTPAVYGQEFDRLLQHPDIREIVVSGTIITVRTRVITITHASQAYEIGTFDLQIHTDGAHGGVLMKNTARTSDGYPHPHVNTSGQPCLGNIKELIPPLIADHKYGPLIDICIQFLKSYTYNDREGPYRKIEHWPVQLPIERSTS